MNALETMVVGVIENNGGESFAQEVLEYGCQSGIVPELIYHKDTHEWFDHHYDDIMELVKEFEEATGERLHWEGDLKNWFAWFSFEETVRKLYS